MAYIEGASVELPITFTVTATGELVDPTTITLTLRAPDGTITTYTYPSAQIVRDSLGTYRGIVVPNDDGEWLYEWVSTGAGAGVASGAFEVTQSISDALPTLTVTYASVQALRDELGVSDDRLSDQDAKRVLLDAEDVIDQLLGAATSDPDPSGRKVRITDVEAWQWAKLSRATVKVAALLHANPGLLDGQQWTSVSGPDFSFSGPRGAKVGTLVIGLLNDSGLRNLTGRARSGIGVPALASRFFGSERY